MSYNQDAYQQRQQRNRNIKESVTQMMKLQMQNIYRVCSNSCIKDYNKFDLTDREKICLSRCYERKSETLNMTLEQFGQMSQVKE